MATTVTVNDNLYIEARFTQVFDKYNLNIQVNGGGGYETVPPGGTYEIWTRVHIKAIPDSEQRFVGWSGLPKEKEPDALKKEISVDMTGNLSLTANFKSRYIGADNIYFTTDRPEEQYFKQQGNGRIKIILSDLFFTDQSSKREFSEDTHGFRVRKTFLKYTKPNYTLYSFEGNSGNSFRAAANFYKVNPTETIIISASSHRVDPDKIWQESRDEVEDLKKTNALYLSALENLGVDGRTNKTGPATIYKYPHAGNVYVIQDDDEALAKTIFVVWFMESRRCFT